MNVGARFMAYAADFERTYADDEWGRLRAHFCDDAVYEVKSPSFPCRLIGPDAILEGMKRSLDGFDRRFDSRNISVVGAPVIEGDELRVSWNATYRKGDFEPFVLRGSTVATVRDGALATLSDIYDDAVEGELEAWMKVTGMQVNASYT